VNFEDRKLALQQKRGKKKGFAFCNAKPIISAQFETVETNSQPIEGFSIGCRKSKTKVIILTNHNTHYRMNQSELKGNA